MNNYLSALKKYAVFNGRSTRTEYWTFVLGNALISFALGYADGALGLSSVGSQSILAGVFQLAILIPSIAVAIRRMHDVNKSGWFVLIPIYNLILALTPSASGKNKYDGGATTPEVK
jgi:uncharacterized membrane protein YhaH (DUF805 family)